LTRYCIPRLLLFAGIATVPTLKYTTEVAAGIAKTVGEAEFVETAVHTVVVPAVFATQYSIVGGAGGA
jgi:hypothetical protein